MSQHTNARSLIGSLVRDLRERLREEAAWGETHVPLPDPAARRPHLPVIPALAPKGRAAGPGAPPQAPVGRPQAPSPVGPPPRRAPGVRLDGPPPQGRAPAQTSSPDAPALFRDVPPGAEGLALVRERLGDCQRCKLCSGRTTLVFGEGAPDADLMFVGEGPGFHEDKQGRPFVGPSGQLLDRMIAAMGYGRDEVYIANVVKCRPPNNRDPEMDERLACRPYVFGQIQAVQPKIIVTLGRTATQVLLETDRNLAAVRGQLQTYPHLPIPVMPTYHPSALLRAENLKRPTWEDLKKVMELLGKVRR
jgi:DNA polymerase